MSGRRLGLWEWFQGHLYRLKIADTSRFEEDFDKVYDPARTDNENKTALLGLADEIRDRETLGTPDRILGRIVAGVPEWEMLYRQYEDNLLLVECLYHCALIGRNVNRSYFKELPKETSLVEAAVKERVHYEEDANFRKQYRRIVDYLKQRARELEKNGNQLEKELRDLQERIVSEKEEQLRLQILGRIRNLKDEEQKVVWASLKTMKMEMDMKSDKNRDPIWIASPSQVCRSNERSKKLEAFCIAASGLSQLDFDPPRLLEEIGILDVYTYISSRGNRSSTQEVPKYALPFVKNVDEYILQERNMQDCLGPLKQFDETDDRQLQRLDEVIAEGGVIESQKDDLEAFGQKKGLATIHEDYLAVSPLLFDELKGKIFGRKEELTKEALKWLGSAVEKLEQTYGDRISWKEEEQGVYRIKSDHEPLLIKTKAWLLKQDIESLKSEALKNKHKKDYSVFVVTNQEWSDAKDLLEYEHAALICFGKKKLLSGFYPEPHAGKYRHAFFDFFLKQLASESELSIEETDAQALKTSEQTNEEDISNLVAGDESDVLEFKSSFRYDLKNGTENSELEYASLKAICSFLNSKRGGTLIIGVNKDPQRPVEERILGLVNDYQTFDEEKNQNRDGFERCLWQKIVSKIERISHAHFVDSITITFPTSGGKEICKVKISQAHEPAWLEEPKKLERTFYIRKGNSSHPLSAQDASEYIRRHWPSESGL